MLTTLNIDILAGSWAEKLFRNTHRNRLLWHTNAECRHIIWCSITFPYNITDTKIHLGTHKRKFDGKWNKVLYTQGVYSKRYWNYSTTNSIYNKSSSRLSVHQINNLQHSPQKRPEAEKWSESSASWKERVMYICETNKSRWKHLRILSYE